MVDIFEKREYLASCATYGPLDENEGCSVVDAFGKREYFANCTTYGPLTKTWVVWWLTCLENGSLASRTTYGRPTKRGWYGWCFLILGLRYIFIVSYGGREVELESLLVAFELLVCVDIY